MTTIIATLPKVELYCRVTDAMDRFQASELAKAAGLPEGTDEAALDARLKVTDAAEFLAASSWQAQLVRSAANLQQLANRTAKRMIAHAVVHAELAVDICALPCTAKEAFDAIDEGIADAVDDSDDAFFSWSLVGELRRGTSGADACAAIDAWHDIAEERLCAISIVGDESVPVGELNDAVRLARKHGLSVAVQAGLTGRARHLTDAIALEADRVLHGTGVTRSDKAMLHLRARRVPVLVAPALEVACGRAKSFTAHPIARMQEGGLFVTVASVSPGLIDCDLTGQLEALSQHQGWRLDRIRNLMLRSVESAFMRPRDRFVIARAVENWRHRPKLTAGSEDTGFGM